MAGRGDLARPGPTPHGDYRIPAGPWPRGDPTIIDREPTSGHPQVSKKNLEDFSPSVVNPPEGAGMAESPETRPSLLVRIRDLRDQRAWSEFVAIYSALIYDLARRRGLQDADAADLVQEVLRAVAGAIDRWDLDPQRGSFRGWLGRIARNLIVNFLIKQERQPRSSGDSRIGCLLEEQPAPEGPESALFDAEYRRRLLAWAAEQIRPEFRPATWSAFWMAGVEGKDPHTVAEALGISVGAVYHNKSRVMARLRQRIEEIESNG
jgi:RNA polymerase sigma-70 factor (ECF subfamily)